MPRECRYCRPKSRPVETLLSFLARTFTYLSEEEWQHHLREGHVRVNDVLSTDAQLHLQQGDRIGFAPPRSLEPPVDEEHVDVLYEDNQLVVVAKNGGIPVAEGGRYCENTLLGVLQRRGTKTFYTKETTVGETFTVVQDSFASSPLATSSPTVGNGQSSKDDELMGMKRPSDTAPPVRWGGRHGVLQDAEPAAQTGSADASGCEDAKKPLSSSPPFYTVQRLDKETSGVVVLCKDKATTKALAMKLEAQTRDLTRAVESLVQERGDTSSFTSQDIDDLLRCNAKRVHKTYTAVLKGVIPPAADTFVIVNRMGTLAQHPLHAQDPHHRQLSKLKMCCEPLPLPSVKGGASSSPPLPAPSVSHDWGKVAATRIRVLGSSAILGLTCVEVELLTGRSHQIRVHCASIGYPVLGDKLYTTLTPGNPGGAVAVPDTVYLARVRETAHPYIPCGNLAGDGIGEEGSTLLCRRQLLHATHLSFLHPHHFMVPCGSSFVSSPVPFFIADVRFAAEEKTALFQEWLTACVLRGRAR